MGSWCTLFCLAKQEFYNFNALRFVSDEGWYGRPKYSTKFFYEIHAVSIPALKKIHFLQQQTD